MNAYFIITQKMGIVYEDVIDWDLRVPEYGYIHELVFAPSRSRARYLFWKAHQRWLGDLKELEVFTRLIDKDCLGQEEGFAGYDCPLWENVPLITGLK